MRGRLLLLIFVMAMIPVSASAQSATPIHRGFEFDVFGTTSRMGEHGNLVPQVAGSATPTVVDLKYSFAAALGASVTENLGQHWGANLEYSFSNQPLSFAIASDTLVRFNARNVVHRLGYEIQYYPFSRYHRPRPYVFAGPGVDLFHIQQSSKDAASNLGFNLTDSWKGTFNWGAGFKYLIQDRVVVNAHITDTISGLPRYGFPRSAFKPDGLIHNWQIGFGFGYQFDVF